jgi:hypothetical protein
MQHFNGTLFLVVFNINIALLVQFIVVKVFSNKFVHIQVLIDDNSKEISVILIEDRVENVLKLKD